MDVVVTKKVNDQLDKEVKALLVPQEAKCSNLQMTVKQSHHRTNQPREHFSDVMSKIKKRSMGLEGYARNEKRVWGSWR